MARMRLFVGFILGCGAIHGLSEPAGAQTARYIGNTGNDANACTRSAPCLTLQRGVDAVTSSGIVQVLSPGSYGSATIDRAITITISGEGTAAAVGRITINSSGAKVTLRRLLLNGTSAGNGSGIVISSAAAIHVVHCEIERFQSQGILVNSSNSTEVFVTDSIIRNNGLKGLYRTTGDAGSSVTVQGARIENNGYEGVWLEGVASAIGVAITNTVVSGNGSHGIVRVSGNLSAVWTTSTNNGANGYYVTKGGAMTLTSTTALGNAGHGYALLGSMMNIEASTASGNDHGLSVGFGATAVISNSVFTRNQTGIQNGGTVLSRKTNTVILNTSNLAGNAISTLNDIGGVQ